MTLEQETIIDLYNMLDDITTKCRNRDLSFARIAGISGCDMYQGLPPIQRAFDSICDKHEDTLYTAFKAKEMYEDNLNKI